MSLSFCLGSSPLATSSTLRRPSFSYQSGSFSRHCAGLDGNFGISYEILVIRSWQGKLASKGFKSKRQNHCLRGRCLRVLSSFQEALADLAPTTSATYGFLLLSGGLYAYNKSGSKGSLFGGLTGAALMGIAYFLIQAPETKAIGEAVGFGSAFLFASVFGIRLAANKKLIPAGPLFGLSTFALAVFIFAYMRDNI